MKKQKKQMILLVALLLIVVGSLVGLRAYNSAQAGKPAEEDGEIVIGMEYADTELLTYTYEGETYNFERIDDVWYVTDDHSLNVKQYRISSMLSSVAPLTAIQIIENVTDLSQYGLDEPERTIIFGNDMEQFTLAVGDHNSLSSSYYVRINDSAEVYVVSYASIIRFDYALEELLDETTETEAETETEADADAGTQTEASTDDGTVASETVQ